MVGGEEAHCFNKKEGADQKQDDNGKPSISAKKCLNPALQVQAK